MLAEAQIALSALSVISKAVKDGRDLYKAGKAFGDLMGAKDGLQKQLAKERRSGGTDSTLSSFLALEEIKKREQHIKEQMIWAGRPGMWADYQKFCEQAKQARRAAELKRHRRRQEILDALVIVGILITLLGMVALMVWAAMYARGDL